MKIPFLHYHIVSTQVICDKLLAEQERDKMCEQLDAMRWLTSDCVPDLEQLAITLREARVGAAAYGRRKARRKVLRKIHELKEKMEAA